MMLWFILTAMLVAAAIGLTVPLVRRYDARRASGGAVGVLKQQLDELDARAAAEAIPPAEAEGMRTEIKRRILAESGQTDPAFQPLGERALVVVALGMIAIVVLGGTGLYLKFGRPNMPSDQGVTVAPAAAGGAASDPAHPGGGDTVAMIGQLEAKLKASPNDPEGWRMLGWSYVQTGRYADAANAYGRAASLDPKAEFFSAQGEALVQAASGQVTGDARAAFKKAVAADPTDPRARYFLAVDKDQQGDHKGAMADWIALLKSAPPDAPWAGQVRAFVIKIAGERGVDVSGQLPPAPAGAAMADAGSPPPPPSTDTNAPGPTPDQVAQASQMAPADQQAMIQNMVEGLDSKLKASPRDPNGWVRLMRARMVLNQPDAASAAFRQAMKTYSDDSNQQAAFKDAAHQLGIPGA
ncbi:MAG TPA: c-type cytochrome biogenesis protein CcmI [Caulobacteraceae bacterium]|jgi:cytochrome c-type biogenesis protein CcmH|nr:c-type cytochrome biogenesis protein CcmI [Caulobacteraceae bacterium]